jgi:NADH-quinone oxidoreductase subunit J
VVVLFVFVLMLLGPDAQAPPRPGRSGGSRLLGGGLFAIGSLWVLVALTGVSQPPRGLGPTPAGYGSAEAIGALLFSDGIFAFELATALLIAAVVGAIAVARGRQGAVRKRREVRSPLDFFGGPIKPRSPGAVLPGEGAE